MLSAHWFQYLFQKLQIMEYIKETGMAEGIVQMFRRPSSLPKSDHFQGFGSQHWQMLTEIHLLVYEKGQSCNMTSQRHMYTSMCTLGRWRGFDWWWFKIKIFLIFFTHNKSLEHLNDTSTRNCCTFSYLITVIPTLIFKVRSYWLLFFSVSST